MDCFKTDFGERIPTDVVWSDGADPERMHNFYSYLYNQTVFELLRSDRGEQEAVVFARSATAGGKRFPVHWGGNCESTFVSTAETLRGGLSLAMSGFGFWSHDIGGFEGRPDPAGSSDGFPLACCAPIAGCTAVTATACPGFSTRSRSRCYAGSPG